MYKKIDSHIHISSPDMVGKIDPISKSKFEPYGIVVKIDGSRVPIMPEYFTDSSFLPDGVVKTMDALGIEKAVIQQSTMFDRTELVVEAVKTYPDRFRGAMLVDVSTDAATCEKKIETDYARGLTSLKFEMNAIGPLYPDFTFASDLFDRIAAKCSEMRVPIAIDTGPITGRSYQVENFRKVTEKYPDLYLVICHLGFPIPSLSDPAVYKRWQEMIRLAKYQNVYFDAAAMPDFFDKEGYPFPTALRLAREFIDTCGEDKLLWGSDIPGTLGRATYAQQFRMFEESGMFTESELTKLLYSNAEHVYFQ